MRERRQAIAAAAAKKHNINSVPGQIDLFDNAPKMSGTRGQKKRQQAKWKVWGTGHIIMLTVVVVEWAVELLSIAQ